MAESDVSESSVNLVDLSDQIDAKLSEEGGNIFQAEGSLRVCPYNRKYISQACIYKPCREGRNEQPGEARLAVGAEGGRYGKLK